MATLNRAKQIAIPFLRLILSPRLPNTRAGERAFVALLVAAEHGATVGAGVDQSVQLALLVAGHHHWLAADIGGGVIVDLGLLAFVRQVHPPALGDVFHLQVEQLLGGEDIAAAAEHAGGRVFLDRFMDLSSKRVDVLVHGLGPPLFLYQAIAP